LAKCEDHIDHSTSFRSRLNFLIILLGLAMPVDLTKSRAFLAIIDHSDSLSSNIS